MCEAYKKKKTNFSPVCLLCALFLANGGSVGEDWRHIGSSGKLLL